MQLCRSPSICCCAQQALQAHCRVFRSLHLSKHSSTACSGNPTLAAYFHQLLSDLSFLQGRICPILLCGSSGTCFAYMDQRSVPRALSERSKSCSGSHVLAVQAAIHCQKSDHRAEGQSSGCKVHQEEAEQTKIRQQDSDEQWSQAAAWSASQGPCQSQAADCEAPGILLPLIGLLPLRDYVCCLLLPLLLPACTSHLQQKCFGIGWAAGLNQSTNLRLLSLALIRVHNRQ